MISDIDRGSEDFYFGAVTDGAGPNKLPESLGGCEGKRSGGCDGFSAYFFYYSFFYSFLITGVLKMVYPFDRGLSLFDKPSNRLNGFFSVFV